MKALDIIVQWLFALGLAAIYGQYGVLGIGPSFREAFVASFVLLGLTHLLRPYNKRWLDPLLEKGAALLKDLWLRRRAKRDFPSARARQVPSWPVETPFGYHCPVCGANPEQDCDAGLHS